MYSPYKRILFHQFCKNSSSRFTIFGFEFWILELDDDDDDDGSDDDILCCCQRTKKESKSKRDRERGKVFLSGVSV